jgi:hypothetical protein
MTGTPNIPNAASAQYREAAPNQEHKTLGFGQSYTNEADPSWEDVIVMVYIPGEPGRVKAAAQGWRILFDRINEIKRLLDDGTKDLETWRGQAGQAYRDHLTEISKDLEKIVTENQRLPVTMDAAADHLQNAINQIQVPSDLLHEVFAAKQSFLGSGNFDTSPWTRNAVTAKLTPIVANKWFDEIGEWVGADKISRALTEWFSDFDEKAKAAYQQVREEHLNTMSTMPNASNIGQYTTTPTELDLSGPTGPGSGAKLPGSGGLPGGGGLPKSGDVPGIGSPPGTGGLPTTDGQSYPGSDLNSDGLSGDDLAGSGLAGAGGGGLGGLGSTGLGGLGGGGLGGLGSGGGLGGLDATGGGLGAGAGRGGLSGMGGLTPGMGGAGGVAGGKAGAGGRGGGRAGMGGMGPGMGGHGGGGGDGDGHATWLQEDDDVWGADSDAPPSVLG